ncbi:MAG TPA: ABC transporter ATP-binding protein [Burkholderiales bacterium]|nr:ABC transporter ATP-binding protein [Burkholderiales bacterium]
MLKLESVAKRFGARRVFEDVSLALAPGEFVAVMGESGIGKSTLLNVIAGLEPADAGRVFFDGHEITGMDDEALARLRRDAFGFVFQAFHVLPHLTVLENVSLPLLLRGRPKGETSERSLQMLRAVGLGERAAGMPRELSGGELQRVAIARALVGAPKLVLADEPTGNLDPDNARQVLLLLKDQVKARGAAAVLATHSDWAAAQCDRVYRLAPDGLNSLPAG